MQLFIFARFHVRAGSEPAATKAVIDVVRASREEPGCASIHGFRSVRDPQLFYIHSCWADEKEFEKHALRPHTVRFTEEMEKLVDQPAEVSRTEQIA